MKKIFLVLLVVLAGIILSSQIVLADNAILSVSPASATKPAGTSFSVGVNVNPTGNKVCVVKGTLTFNNLTCRSISVASGLMAQTTPTCASPNFTLGIPNCTSALQNILSVSVKGGQAGSASLEISGARVIGVGVNVAFAYQGGTYTISAVPAEKPAQQPVEQQPTEQPITTQAPVEQTAAPANNVPASTQTASFASIASAYSWPLVIILIVLIFGYVIYYFVKRKKI